MNEGGEFEQCSVDQDLTRKVSGISNGNGNESEIGYEVHR